jgi:hypothetical protein
MLSCQFLKGIHGILMRRKGYQGMSQFVGVRVKEKTARKPQRPI